MQLESAATDSEVDFRSIDVASGASAPRPPRTPPAPRPYGRRPARLHPDGQRRLLLHGLQPPQFKGSYLRLAELFARLERFVKLHGDRIDVSGRLLRVEGPLTMSPNGGDYRHLNPPTVNASTYLVRRPSHRAR